jgi:hypothetical protein
MAWVAGFFGNFLGVLLTPPYIEVLNGRKLSPSDVLGCSPTVLRVSVEEVLLPSLTSWGRPVRKSRIQLLRDEFCPRVRILGMSLEWTIVLNAEM